MEFRLFKNWWLLTLKGLLAIGFGMVLLIKQYPLIKTSLVISFGGIVIASGIMIFSGAFLHKKNNPRWRLWLIEGLIDITLGTFFILETDFAKAFFLIFLALWAFGIGIVQILTSVRMATYMDRWWSMLIAGVFSIGFAVLAFINPFYTRFAMGATIGAACILFGLILVYTSRLLRNIYL